MLLLTVGTCVKSKINYSYTTFYYDKIEYRPTILYFYVIYARSEDYYYVFFCYEQGRTDSIIWHSTRENREDSNARN